MPDLIVLERKDREGGQSHMWVNCDGERVRFAIDTKTLDGPEGWHMLTLIASRAAETVRTARERGRLKLEG